jgi:deoxyribodipyrimidine photo-lyase
MSDVIFWLRRDLRSHDNAGLHAALQSGGSVVPLFIFDTNILSELPSRKDRRVSFIYDNLKKLNEEFRLAGSRLIVKIGSPREVFVSLAEEYDIGAVYANEDYEPYATARDAEIWKMLAEKSIPLHLFKDQVIFAKDDVLKPDGDPYTIYTPYKKKWKEKLSNSPINEYPSEKLTGNLKKLTFRELPPPEEIGFEYAGYSLPEDRPATEIIKKYDELRNFPSIDGTTRIGPDLRFGAKSIRRMVRLGLEYNETWLDQLIWREFFHMILYHFPYSAEGAFRKKYDNVEWINDPDDFRRWRQGRTGFPMVDAGMRQLNETGYMHNRVRMIAAGFLTKNLLTDWRLGERYFAGKLLDYDMANNVGGWQWAAGTGCDAAPYFRVFNPLTQQKKFDPEGEYVRRWIPEPNNDYTAPVVDLKESRSRAIEAFKRASGGG